MGSAKEIILKPVSSAEARAAIKRLHYSGRSAPNSQLHIGVYYNGRLEGAMQFGPPLDKRKLLPLVNGTAWHQMIELNRMAFSDVLPRNSESRALAIAMRILKKHAPQLKWVVSFADAAQCGDGTIYRASGFVLTGIKRNNQVWRGPNGDLVYRLSVTKDEHIKRTGGASMKPYIEAGYKPIDGYQLRYVYFLDASWASRLTVDSIPYERIRQMGASMYRGEKQ